MNAFSGIKKSLTLMILTLLVSFQCMAQMNLNVDAGNLFATWNPASGSISGYNFFLSNTMIGSTTDTFYTIPSNLVMYGLIYHACVTAMSIGVPVDSSCTDFMSLFLCPASNLAVDSIDNAAYLTWDKPGCVKDMQIKSIRRPGEDKSSTTDTGLIGYNVYRNYAFLKFIPGPDSLSTYDMDLDDGTYCYDVRAKYDLTAFNQPPGYGESGNNTTGPACLTIHANGILPFFEYWDSGNFGFNGWTNDPNWSVNLTGGIPSPCADFSGQPAILGYEQSLVGETLDASLIMCSVLWLDFDLNLIDNQQTGNEHLAVELFFDTTWHPVTSYANNGTTDWIPKHLDISDAIGKPFKIRFRAYGNNSVDILHWYIDNIHVYARCSPARELSAEYGMSPFCGAVHLTWRPPLCQGIPPGTHLDEGFEGMNFPPPNFTSVITNPTYTWSHTDATSTWGVHSGGYSAGVYWDFDHQDEWLIAHNIAIIGDLTFWSYAFQGSTYLDHYYVKISIDGGTNWTELLDLSALPPYPDWNLWQTPYVIDLSGYSGLMADIAWQAIDGDGQCLWYNWAIDDCTVGSDKLCPVPTNQNASRNPFSEKRSAIDPDTHRKLSRKGVHPPSSKAVADAPDYFLGYDIYRQMPGQTEFFLLNSEPVTDTSYCDMNIGFGWNYYYVSSRFDPENCSYSQNSNVDSTFVYVGIEESDAGKIMISPNPADETINIASHYGMISIDILDLMGQTVYQGEEDYTKSARINTTLFNPGVYIVKVQTKERLILRKITLTH